MASRCEPSLTAVKAVAHRRCWAIVAEGAYCNRDQSFVAALTQTSGLPARRRGLSHQGTCAERGKPIFLPLGRRPARGADRGVGKGSRRKRMPACNALDAGKFPGTKVSRLTRGLSSRESVAKRLRRQCRWTASVAATTQRGRTAVAGAASRERTDEWSQCDWHRIDANVAASRCVSRKQRRKADGTRSRPCNAC